MSLDPRQRRLEREVEKAREEARIPQLNPPFPWRAIGFDVSFFGVDEPPPDPPAIVNG